MCKALEKLEEKGRQEGALKTKLKLIIKKIHKNKSFDQIVDELEEDSDVVQPLYDFVLKHIDLGEDEMVQKYLENIDNSLCMKYEKEVLYTTSFSIFCFLVKLF